MKTAKEFIKPEFDFVELEMTDVITTSGPSPMLANGKDNSTGYSKVSLLGNFGSDRGAGFGGNK